MSDGRFQRAMFGESNVMIFPQTLAVKLGDFGDGVVAAVKIVTGVIAVFRQAPEERHVRATREVEQFRLGENFFVKERSNDGVV